MRDTERVEVGLDCPSHSVGIVLFERDVTCAAQQKSKKESKESKEKHATARVAWAGRPPMQIRFSLLSLLQALGPPWALGLMIGKYLLNIDLVNARNNRSILIAALDLDLCSMLHTPHSAIDDYI
eukprot:scaffold564_cov97-Skeletonema_marinoi.AAC.2